MAAFWGVVCYEYRMAVHRWGMWVAFAICAIPCVFRMEANGTPSDPAVLWQAGGSIALWLNFLLPVVGGIAMADHLARDWRLNVRELLGTTPLSRPGYVLGKYVGVVAATLTPVLGALIVSLVCLIAQGAPVALVPPALVGFLAIVVPAYCFVGAFSLACPALLPVRVYQVLFAGYWFWGNFLNPKFIPTLAGTVLTPYGEFAGGAFFHSALTGSQPPHTLAEGVLSLLALFGAAALALLALERYLAWQARRA